MLITFRQGLISAPALILQASATPNYINLVVDQKPILAAIADGSADYLVGIYSSVSNAWGPFTGSTTQYLYVELNGLTGALSYGSTSLPLQSSATAPTSPSIGQMWWDSANYKMYAWDGTSWQRVYRVFLGTLVSGVTLTPASQGTQVGLNTPGRPGYVLTDGFGNTFRDNSGRLLTTETPVVSSNTGSLVKIDGAQVVVQANSPLSAFTCVYLEDGRAEVATSVPPNEITKAPIAIVPEDVVQNAPVELVMAGKTVFNENWNFAVNQWGQPVYCDGNGQITLNAPSAPSHVRVGYIIGANGIYLTFDSFTNPFQSEESISIDVDAPLEVDYSGNTITISLPEATSSVDGYMSKEDYQRIIDLEILVEGKANANATWAQSSIVGLTSSLASKANSVHSHAISDVTGLQNALDGKLPTSQAIPISQVTGLASAISIINTTLGAKIGTKPTATVGNLAMFDDDGHLEDSGKATTDFAAASHSHTIANITNLQSTLNGKASTSHTHEFSEITGLQTLSDTVGTKATKVSGGTTGNFVKLTITGDLADSDYSSSSFALASHTHEISAVSGLQTALDGKAASSHTHSIANITNLQTTLDGKAATSHTHTISNVTGLQTALDGKLATSGGTISGSLTLGSSAIVFNTNGSISFSSSVGTTGQVLTSNGTGAVPTWQNSAGIPAGGTAGQVLGKVDETNYNVTWIDPEEVGVSEPVGQIVYGSGASITSSSKFSFSGTTLSVQSIQGIVGDDSEPETLVISAFPGGESVDGGEVRIVGGDNYSGGNAGKVAILGGTSSDGNGGDVEIFTGISGEGSVSGNLSIGTATGNSTNGSSGDIVIATGEATGTGSPGKISLRTAGLDRLVITAVGEFQLSNGVGSAGKVLTSNGAGGPPSWEDAGVNIDLNAIPYGAFGGGLATDDRLAYNPASGWIIAAGLNGTTDEEGEPVPIEIYAAQATAFSAGGAVYIAGGNSGTDQDAGEVALSGGASTGTGGNGGNAYFTGGGLSNNNEDTEARSGNVVVETKTPGGTVGSSGSITIQTGDTSGAGDTGNIIIKTGESDSGAHGYVDVRVADVSRLLINAQGAFLVSSAFGSEGQVLTSHGENSPPTWEDATGGSGSPAGLSGNIQFNSEDSFAGDSNLSWDNTNKTLLLGASSDGETPQILGGGHDGDSDVPFVIAGRNGVDAENGASVNIWAGNATGSGQQGGSVGIIAGYNPGIPDISLTSGFASVVFTEGKTGADAAGLISETEYTATIGVSSYDEEGTVEIPLVIDGGDVTDLDSLISLLNVQTDGYGVWSIDDGELIVTAVREGADTEIYIDDVDLFSSLTDFSEITFTPGTGYVAPINYGGTISVTSGNRDANTGGGVNIYGGGSANGFGGTVLILSGLGKDLSPNFNGSIILQTGNNTSSITVTGTGAVSFNGNLGFYGASPVSQPVIDATTTEDLLEQVIDALVALGLVDDQRVV